MNLLSDNASNPLVSVYIPCRNYGRFLEQAVKSVQAQLYGRWELFIVNEASGDNTAVVAEYFRSKDPDRVTVITNEAPQGLQKVANTVLGIANGRYIIRLDADDWLDETAILLMVAKLQSDQTLGIVYGNYFYTDETGNVLGMERRHKLGVEDMAGHLPPHGACTMVSTRALKTIGGYSEDINAQDGWELWYKLLNKTKAANLEAPIFYYRQHNNSLSRDAGRLLSARSKIFQKIDRTMEGSYEPRCVAVIGVKESYPDFEGVPYRIFQGKSLLQRAIESATEAKNVSHVVVSSHSQSVLDYAHDLEDKGLVAAHSRLLRATTTKADTLHMREILVQAGEMHHDLHDVYPDIVAFLSVHAPLRHAKHVEKGLHVLRITGSDSVVSVIEEREPMFSYGTNGLDLLNQGRFQDLTYDRERLYRFNGALIATWWDAISTESILGSKIGFIEMSPHDSIQVKSESDLA